MESRNRCHRDKRKRERERETERRRAKWDDLDRLGIDSALKAL